MKQSNEKSTLYDKLIKVGMIIIPLAPAVATSWSMYEWSQLKGMILPLSIVAGMAAGPGMELFLAVTGHIMLTLNKQKDKTWIVGLIVMIAYPIIGLSYYGFNIAGVMFLIAALFYLMLALLERAKRNAAELIGQQQIEQRENERQAEQKDKSAAWQREQKALELAHRRELARLEQQAQLAPPSQSVPLIPPLLKAKMAVLTPALEQTEWSMYTRWTQIPDDMKQTMTQLSKDAFDNACAHLSTSTRRRWWMNLEAYRHG